MLIGRKALKPWLMRNLFKQRLYCYQVESGVNLLQEVFQELTGDQAVSSRHAVLRVADDGNFAIVDVGSTNGTFLDAVDSDAIAQGQAVEIKPGTAIYLGAWTRLTILD